MGGYVWYLLKAAMFVLGAFVFAFIFWGTKNWMDKCCPSKKKKK